MLIRADMVWREIALLRDHGATPMQSVGAATSSAARLLGVDGETSSIELGKLADLVLVDGDPVADLSRLATPVGVWQGGRSISA